MKILIAIESCVKNRHLHQAMVDTWLGDLAFDFKFFIGGISEPQGDHEVWVPCLDTYEGLVAKTKGICRWADTQGYDYLFKCDTDTVVHPSRLICSLKSAVDYLGGFNEDVFPSELRHFFPAMDRIQFASGGAGYWLSRQAMQIVGKGLATLSPAEDVYVASQLFLESITPVWHEGYRWKPGSKIEGAVTFHTSSALQVKHEAKLMYEYYEKIIK